MKTALHYKWQQSLSSFIEKTLIELSVSSVQSTLGITEMYMPRFLSSRGVTPLFMTPKPKLGRSDYFNIGLGLQ